MRIYYSYKSSRLLSEEEVFEEIQQTIEDNELVFDYLRDLSETELLESLKQEVRLEILSKLQDTLIENDYTYKDF